MNYNFYAAKSDKVQILNYIIEETDLQIFDLTSDYGEEVRQYKNLEDVINYRGLKNDNHRAIYFNLWSPRFKAEPIFSKIDLNPKYSQGQTFRYDTNGWGLIQLYLGGIAPAFATMPAHLTHSHLGHFNEKGAIARQTPVSFMGLATDWDWREVRKASNNLKYFLDKKLAVKRKGPEGVMPGAAKLEEEGLLLRY